MCCPAPLALVALVFLAALLSASAGHAGASDYLAAMAWLGGPPEIAQPTALALNIIVAAIATFKFQRAGHFDRRLDLWPALGAVPLAFGGGSLTLPIPYFKAILGLVLAFLDLRIIWPLDWRQDRRQALRRWPAVPLARRGRADRGVQDMYRPTRECARSGPPAPRRAGTTRLPELTGCLAPHTLATHIRTSQACPSETPALPSPPLPPMVQPDRR